MYVKIKLKFLKIINMVTIMANYITLGFNILCLTLIVTGMLWGLIRGLKKTLSRFLFLLILGIILIFLTIPITNVLLKIKISTSFIGEEGELVRQVPIKELLSIFIERFIGEDFLTKYPEFSELLATLPLTLIYSIVFVILFWILKLILLPLNAFINRLTFNRKPKLNQFGFSYFDQNTEYPNSDSSIQPLMDIYKQSESAPDPEPQKAINTTFIKTDTQHQHQVQQQQQQQQQVQQQQVQQQIEKPKTKKQIKKERKALEKENRPPQHRLLGCIVGAFVGTMLIFFTMIPVYGIVNISDNIKSTKINHLTDKPTTINDLSNGVLVDIVKGYDISALGRISEALFIENLAVKTFDRLSSVTINNNNINLREDVNAIVNCIVKADTLIGKLKIATDSGLDTLTQEDLNILIDNFDEVITACSEIKFINSMNDYILPITYELIETNEIKLINNNKINSLVVELISDLTKVPEINIFNELKNLVEIAKYINTQGLLYPLVTGNTEHFTTIIDNLDDDFGTQLPNKIFAVKTVNTTFPQILNIGLTYFDSTVKFGYVENEATKAEITDSFKKLIENIVATAKSISAESPIYLTDDSILKLGKTLDSFRNSKLFNLETYNNLVDYTINQVKAMTTDIIPNNLTDVFNNKLLRNVEKVENWETEMSIIYDTLQMLRDKDSGFLGDIVEHEEKRIGYTSNFEISEKLIINLGKALDKLEKSVLLGSDSTTTYKNIDYTNTTLLALLHSSLKEAYYNIKIEDETTHEILEVINNIRENLVKSSHSYTNNSKFWENEASSIAPLIVEISNILDSNNFEFSAELGEKLDQVAHNSIMLGNNTTLVLMEKIMAVVQNEILGKDFTPNEDDSINDNIYNTFIAMRNNLLSENVYNELISNENFWKNEINCIISLRNIADKSDTITNISSAMTISEDLDNIYNSKIVPSTEINITLASILRDIKTEDTTGINGKINSLIENIATDISSNTFFDDKVKANFWTIELAYINTLYEIEFEDNDAYKVVDNLSIIGANIDNIVFGKGTTRASYLITENRIRDILSFVIKDIKTNITDGFEIDISSTLDEIATNLYDNTADEQVELVSFERELGNLTILANLDISSDLFEYTNDPTQLEALENKLAYIGASLDSIAYNTTTSSNIISYYEAINSNIITRSMLANIISSAFSTAKVVEGAEPLTNTEKTFNTLIENIQTSIETISIEDKVMSWTRELSYISTLIQLNSGKEFTLENAATDIGKNIDKIAFNHKGNSFLDVTYNADNNIVGKYVVKEIDDTNPDNPITTYYNSLIITRNILKTAVNSMVKEFEVVEPNDQEKIANELIDNLSTRVETITYSTTIYNDYETALTDINSVKTIMEDTADSMADITVDNFGDEHITTIDDMLDSVESKIICGTTTTRKIAVMLVKDFKIMNPSTDEETIINDIIDILIAKINGGEVNDYAVVFAELKDIQSEMTSIKSQFDNKQLVSFTEKEFIAIDQMLESFQDKIICGTITTRKIAKLMMEKAKYNLTNKGENNTIMTTEVGTYIESLITYYSTSTADREIYYSTTSSDEKANPMATIYKKLEALGQLIH